MASLLTTSAVLWEVDLDGRTVAMVAIDHRVSLHLRGEADDDAIIAFGSPFKISTEGATSVIDPEEKATLTPLLECFGKTVAAVTVSRGEGVLAVSFTDGTAIDAASDATYEAWEVSAPGVHIVAMPGGGEPALFI